MNCREWKNEFTTWQKSGDASDGLPGALPPALGGHLIKCPGCRFRYETYATFSRTESWHTTVPAALPDKIMNAVRQRALAPGYRPFPAPMFAIPLAAAVLTVLLWLIIPHQEQAPVFVTVKLVLAAPHARTVSVAGDWNNWLPDADRLSDANGDGIWEIELQLTQNKEYRYQFIINGESWIPDPRADLQVDDGFGGTNSVLGI